MRWLNLLMLTATIVVNALANTVQINGLATGEISDQFPTPITPSGYVFSIWSVIYIALIAFVIYGLTAGRSNRDIDRASVPFWLNCVLNIGWIFAWHYGYYQLSLALMVGIIASLIWIWLALGLPGKRRTGAAYWCISFPFLVYLGWITVALLANTMVAMLAGDWSIFGLSQQQVGVTSLAAASVAALLVGGLRGAPVYAAVVLWAAIGILIKQGENETIWLAATATIVVASLGVALGFWRESKRTIV